MAKAKARARAKAKMPKVGSLRPKAMVAKARARRIARKSCAIIIINGTHRKGMLGEGKGRA